MIKISIEVDRKEELDAIADSYSTASDKCELEGKILSYEWKIKELEEKIPKLNNRNRFQNDRRTR